MIENVNIQKPVHYIAEESRMSEKKPLSIQCDVTNQFHSRHTLPSSIKILKKINTTPSLVILKCWITSLCDVTMTYPVNAIYVICLHFEMKRALEWYFFPNGQYHVILPANTTIWLAHLRYNKFYYLCLVYITKSHLIFVFKLWFNLQSTVLL